MLRHPAWAVSSHWSGPTAAGSVGTKSTGGFTKQMCHPVWWILATLILPLPSPCLLFIFVNTFNATSGFIQPTQKHSSLLCIFCKAKVVSFRTGRIIGNALYRMPYGEGGCKRAKKCGFLVEGTKTEALIVDISIIRYILDLLKEMWLRRWHSSSVLELNHARQDHHNIWMEKSPRLQDCSSSISLSSERPPRSRSTAIESAQTDVRPVYLPQI